CYSMSLENQLAELKYDYVRLQGDLEKRESLNLDTSALVRQLKDIENEIRNVRAQMQD
ncbi:hypothetical protein O233_02591, partial [Staphylococcus aureus M0021]